jgi:uncharacterized protein YqhQ
MIRRAKIWMQSAGRLSLLPATLVARPAPARGGAKGESEILLGGQAVIEGVMMRAPHSYCVAVRTPQGIVQKREGLRRPQDRWRGWGLPGLRGLATIGQSLALGLKALRYSANVALQEESPQAGKKQELPGWLLATQLTFSLLFFLFLYKYVPLVVASEFERRGIEGGWLGFNLIDGLVRIALFLLFISLVSLWKDIRRVYEYHGAEHMVVYNWEAKRPVSIENARAFTPEHPRCGTSFLVLVLLVALVVYALVPVESFGLRLLVRILLLPVIAGVSYEIIRAAGKNQKSAFWRALVTPGLWLQRLITTRKPSDDQIEVAIRALEGALEIERASAQPVPARVN